MDLRMLFHAVCNRFIYPNIGLHEFGKFGRSDIAFMMQHMLPGLDYPRPTAEESMLTAVPPFTPPAESLRMQRDEDEELKLKLSNNLEKVLKRKFGRRRGYQEILDHRAQIASNLGTTPKKLKMSWGCLHTDKEMEAAGFHPDVENAANLRLNKFLEEVIDPESEENIRSRELKDACKDLLDPKNDWKYRVTQGSPHSPATLKSWSGSGWATPTTEGEEGREKEEETNTGEEDLVDDDNPNVSITSLISGISVLDMSPCNSSKDGLNLESDEECDEASPEARRYQELEDSFDYYNDSVELFLAKNCQEGEIVTVSTSSSSKSPAVTDPADVSDEYDPVWTPPGRLLVKGKDDGKPVLRTFYPGAYIDDLTAGAIPPEVYPIPRALFAEADEGTEAEATGCDCKLMVEDGN